MPKKLKMFNIQRSFENSLRSGNDQGLNSLNNRKNPQQHKNCKGKIHGTGHYDANNSKFCEKNITKKSKSSSLSSENCSESDESKKDETDFIITDKYIENSWINDLNKKNAPKIVEEHLKHPNHDSTDKNNKTEIKPLKSETTDINDKYRKTPEYKKFPVRKISSPKIISSLKYGNVLSRVGSFRKKKNTSLPEISFEEITSLALHRKSRKLSDSGNFKDLDELLKNFKKGDFEVSFFEKMVNDYGIDIRKSEQLIKNKSI